LFAGLFGGSLPRMSDDALYSRYKVMTDPPPKWRRWLSIPLLAVLAAAAYFLNEAAHGPLWALAVGAMFGLLTGGLWARSDFRMPREGWRRNVSFAVSYLVFYLSDEFIAGFVHERDSLAFFMAYIIAVVTGVMIGAILLGWSSFSKPRPLVP
jgi:NhaP-type Na+/H+ or K+/H+ antiporter